MCCVSFWLGFAVVEGIVVAVTSDAVMDVAKLG